MVLQDQIKNFFNQRFLIEEMLINFTEWIDF